MKTKNSRLFLAITAIMAMMVITASNMVCVGEESFPQGFGVTGGYHGFRLNDSNASFVHNTHPDDGFLPGANVPGSAGKTSVNDQFLSFAALGLRYQSLLVGKNVFCDVEIGGLIGGDRDWHENANDPRPPANGAFIYTEAMFGFYGSVGLSYHFPQLGGFYVGGEGQLNSLFIDHGWSRYDKDESVQTDLVTYFSVGPKIGYNFNKNTFVEATVQFGQHTGFGASIGYIF